MLRLILIAAFFLTGCAPTRNLSMFAPSNTQCYNRQTQPSTFVVDSHNHFRPFGHNALEYTKLLSYIKRRDILFVTAYGIGQTLPQDGQCQYFTQCSGVPVSPTITNDLINADNYQKFGSQGIHLTLSMSFPDLEKPEQITRQIRLLDKDYPGLFKWMGEVNLVKQALFNNGHQPTSLEKIAQWHEFMTILQQRNIPIAIHSDLGNDKSPTQYLYLMEAVLKQYPNNKIVWVHMGLSKEQSKMNPLEHIQIMKAKLDSHPNLMLDISWRILYDNYFSNPNSRDLYVDFLNQYSTRILPGSDFVATSDKTNKHYKATVEINSKINSHLNNEAFRHIVLGQNYLDLLGLDYRAPDICT